MQYKPILFFIILLTGLNLHAQEKINGHFDLENHMFVSSDTGVLLVQFVSGYAPFMIKYKRRIGYYEGRVGFIDTAGNIVVKPVYSECTFFNGNFAVATDTTGKTGMINTKGDIIIPFAVQHIAKCENGLFLTQINSTISIRDSTNKVIVPYGIYTRFAIPQRPKVEMEGNDEPYNNWRPSYFNVSIHFKNFLGVLKKGKWAVIDRKGREVIPPKFDWIGGFTGSIAPIRMGAKFGVTNALGNYIIPPEYDDARIFNQYFIQVELNKKCGVLSPENKVIIPLIYSDVTLINKSDFLVEINGAYGVIRQNNTVIIPLKNHNIERFGNGYLVGDNLSGANNYGTALFDARGKRITSFIHGATYQEGFIWYMRDSGVMVYRKKSGDFAHYDYIRDKIFCYRGEKFGILDTNGTEITPPIYDNAFKSPFDNFYICRKGGKVVLVTDDGKLVRNGTYDEVECKRNGEVKVRRGKRWGLIDRAGKIIYP